jgi:tetratricopeptide (TPR) repeat protein
MTDPNNKLFGALYHNKGNIYKSKNDFYRTKEYYEYALDLLIRNGYQNTPDFSFVFSNYINLLFELEEYDLAEEFKKIMLAENYRKDIESKNPKEFWDYNSIERRYLSRINRGHKNKAKEILRQMIQIFPEMKDQFLSYSLIYRFAGFDEFIKRTYDEYFDKRLDWSRYHS